MPTREKAATIAELAALLQHSQLAVVTNYRGLNVAALAQLRRTLRGKAELRVTKNTLLERAATEAHVPQLAELLTGPTAVAFITDDIAGSIRALNDFARTSRILTVMGALFGPSLVPAERVNELMAVPTRPQLLAQIVGNVQGPLNTLVGNLNQLVAQVVYALQAYADKKGPAEAAAPEAAAPGAAEAAAPEAAAPGAAEAAAPEAAPPSRAEAAAPEAVMPSVAEDATPEATTASAAEDATPEATTASAAAEAAPEAVTASAAAEAAPEAVTASAAEDAMPEAVTASAAAEAAPEAVTPSAGAAVAPEAATPSVAEDVSPQDGALSVFDGDGVPEDGGPSAPDAGV